MGEEVQMSDYGSAGEDEEQDRMVDWEVGLPGSQDLAPLSQGLIPPELAIAFNIKPAPCRTLLEVNRASQNTLSSIRRQTPTTLPRNGFKSFTETNGYGGGGEGKIIVEEEEERSDGRKIRRIDNNRSGIGCAAEEADSRLDDSNSADDDNNNYTDSDINNNNCSNNNNDNNNQNQSAKTQKRPRLVWTPQLHKRFVDVVGHLGIKNAVPKTIMQLMNVEGLTRENVASHLQKYRLYLKRMHVGGIGDGDYSGGGPSSSDMFATTPVHQSLHEGGGSSGGKGHMGMPIAVPYGGHHPIMPVPIMGMGGHHGGHGHMGMVPQGYGNGFESLNHHYHHHGHGMQQNHNFHQHQRHGMMHQRQRDWIGAYNGSHPHVASHDK